MKWALCARNFALGLIVMTPLGSAWGEPAGQDQAAGQASGLAQATKASDPAQAIDDEYNRQVLALARRRLTQLEQLAASQKPPIAAVTYERLLRLAVADDLFTSAESAADKILEQGTPSPETNALAYLVKIIALADRGSFQESLQSLRRAVAESTADRRPEGGRAALEPGEVIAICEAYYQRLVEARQFPIATAAFQLVLDKSTRSGVKEFLSSRLKRIDLVGKPAPPIQGRDLDGKAFDLAAHKGRAVLVIFWASWSQPNEAQILWLEQIEHAFHDKGLDVVGINLDTQENGGQKLEKVLPNIRRFLLDYNVHWPNLVNGSGAQDFAQAYGVADIPANVLIGPDGSVAQIDLSRRNIESVLSALLGR